VFLVRALSSLFFRGIVILPQAVPYAVVKPHRPNEDGFTVP
jgi:hypothetical protein